MSVAQAPSVRRVKVFDGIRGFAIVIVLLSHTWVVAPMPDSKPLRVLFTSGDFAVSIFFVVGGFLATSGMLRRLDETGALRPGVMFVRRWLRLSSQVYPLVVTVLVLTAIDTNMQAYKLNDTRESAWRIVTYTWNGYVRTHAFEARPDLGHLWYVCTDLWVIGLILVMVFILGRYRWALLAALVFAVVLVMIYRQHVYATEGEFVALIRVQTRADGLLWGAMAAAALPWMRRFAHIAPALGIVATVSLAPLMWAVPAGQERNYFGLAGWALNLALAVFVVSVALAEPHRRLKAVLGWRPLEAIGRYSLVLYIWHFPIFWYVSRNTPDWHWGWRTLASYASTLVIAVTAQWLVEAPMQRWLASDFWTPFQGGMFAGVRAHVGARWAQMRQGRRASTEHNPSAPSVPPKPARDLEDQL